MKRVMQVIVLLMVAAGAWGVNVTIQDPERWVSNDLAPYIGQTVTFTAPWYVINNYNDTYRISPRRI